jgi:thiazolylpeptide-type bacteriocin precursor
MDSGSNAEDFGFDLLDLEGFEIIAVKDASALPETGASSGGSSCSSTSCCGSCSCCCSS